MAAGGSAGRSQFEQSAAFTIFQHIDGAVGTLFHFADSSAHQEAISLLGAIPFEANANQCLTG